MEAARRHGRVLRANLCEIERGVYYATYFQERTAPDTENLPRYHVGKSACEVKALIDDSARALGYEAVCWRESIVIPEFTAQTKTARGESARREPVAVYSQHRGL